MVELRSFNVEDGDFEEELKLCGFDCATTRLANYFSANRPSVTSTVT